VSCIRTILRLATSHHTKGRIDLFPRAWDERGWVARPLFIWTKYFKGTRYTSLPVFSQPPNIKQTHARNNCGGWTAALPGQGLWRQKPEAPPRAPSFAAIYYLPVYILLVTNMEVWLFCLKLILTPTWKEVNEHFKVLMANI
jgi:hypothetical protein